MKTSISAIWQGNFKEGTGQLNGDHSPLHSVGFKSVFGKDKATNPEELLGSAHATCYNLTLSYILTNAGFYADMLQTSAAISLQNNVITNSDLTLTAKIPGIGEEQFQELALQAKGMCAVGNALNAEVNLSASLVS